MGYTVVQLITAKYGGIFFCSALIWWSFLDFFFRTARVDTASLPESYQSNTPKEKLVLSYCENFRRQFVHLYRDRKPLFLNPLNECGVEVHQKFSPKSFMIQAHILRDYWHLSSILSPLYQLTDASGCLSFSTEICVHNRTSNTTSVQRSVWLWWLCTVCVGLSHIPTSGSPYRLGECMFVEVCRPQPNED